MLNGLPLPSGIFEMRVSDILDIPHFENRIPEKERSLAVGSARDLQAEREGPAHACQAQPHTLLPRAAHQSLPRANVLLNDTSAADATQLTEVPKGP